MAPQRAYRTDLGSLRPVTRRADGTIVVDAFLTKAGVFPYRQPDGSVRYELRLPEDVFDPKSLATFEGVPVTNNHPPGMLDAKNAVQYAVGAQLGVPVRDEADHMRGRLAVYDSEMVSAMEAGKLQVSNGYTCDLVETPGIHPLYGKYDAIQKNIVGNHVAIVDRARAGVTAAARMDADCANGMMVGAGTEVAFALAAPARPCKSRAMAQPTARIEVVVKNDASTDPDDEATRNAEGENDAPKAPKRQPGQMADKGGDQGDVVDPDDDDDAATADSSMYDDDGELTEYGHNKIAAASFAIPGKKQLPIHDPKAVKDSMKAFGKHEFDSPDEKHGAFNRIAGKAQQFGMDTAAFSKKHAGNLDRADSAPKDNQMTPTEIKALQEKADKRKEKLEAAKSRIDALETEKAEIQKKLDTAEAALESAKRASAKTDDKPATPAAKADADEQARFDAKLELLDLARSTGATVTSKMTDTEIKMATIKHVDGKDAPAGKTPGYYDALFDLTIERVKKDAVDTDKGAKALAATRTAAAAPAAAHADADDTDEDAAKARLNAANRSMWNARKETK